METFYYHPPPPDGLDDDEEREAVTCSVARNSMYTRIERHVDRMNNEDEWQSIRDCYWRGIMESPLDLYGFSRRTGVRRRPDFNPSFHCHVAIKEKTGEIVWNGKTYPAPEDWRPSIVLKRRRGPKPRRKR